MKLLTLCTSILVVATGLEAQTQPLQRPATVITANPLGFLQFGPTVEAEFTSGASTGFAVGARMPNLGLISHVIDSEIGLSWTAMASIRFYLDRSRTPAGWYVAPRVEAGRSRSGSETYTLKGAALEGAHRWLFQNGKNLSLGAMAGKFESGSGLDGYFVMAVLNLGLGR